MKNRNCNPKSFLGVKEGMYTEEDLTIRGGTSSHPAKNKEIRIFSFLLLIK